MLILRKTLSNLEEILSSAALALVIVSVVYGVFTRYFLGNAAAWTNELAAIAFTWAVFLGTAAAFKRKLHIGVDSFVSLLPTTLARWISLLMNLILLIFLAYGCYIGFDFSIQSYKQPTSILRLPNTYFYISVPISFGLMFIHQSRILMQMIRTA
ncbi:MAG: TRAP transporter small permease [SAR324 cluster bacterium]|jgi:TRAP-type transport system small permease protein|nr:TRAP transporter small permease [SAR324 cluster bacterium]